VFYAEADKAVKEAAGKGSYAEEKAAMMQSKAA
jgi:hypothetical protein